ncbi:MAG: RecQ family ATP-dependent DNA helicase [Spirochaetes bacterium]|nr:RecQ family ATP-dependent DNA helicase [Spirochaetota bacterium]
MENKNLEKSADGEGLADDPLLRAAKSLFDLPYLFPYQRLVMANILEAAQAAGVAVGRKPTDFEGDGGDREGLGKQIVILPTGAGKSLCFQLPAMLMEGATLVIYPILSLMADQERRLTEKKLSPVVLRGGQSKEERDIIWKKVAGGQSKIIIANPEVLLIPHVMERLKKAGIVHIVIDEAHCVSEWGETFRPSYLEIKTVVKDIGAPLVTAFTATASAPVLEKIKRYIFDDEDVMQIVGNPDRANISYSAKACLLPDVAVRDLLLESERPAIVFCSSRHGTEKLSLYLRNALRDMGEGWHREIRFYHAGLSKEEKADVEGWFINNDGAVLCATCAYGMGVDKADIRTVIHRDCPPSVEAYLQEAGRAGRDGRPSKAVLLWGGEVAVQVQAAAARAGGDLQRQRFSAMLEYAAQTASCRRHSLLQMLDYDSAGEVPESGCCDVCEKTASGELREEASFLDFFRKNERRYTEEEAARVIAACETNRLSQAQARYVIGELVGSGKLKLLKSRLWKGKIASV